MVEALLGAKFFENFDEYIVIQSSESGISYLPFLRNMQSLLTRRIEYAYCRFGLLWIVKTRECSMPRPQASGLRSAALAPRGRLAPLRGVSHEPS